ncbi:MAG TPA: protein-glutamate O-methyltransferase CheR [bacterium]|nr:protein-glutamate O-methyltransferase CheR [bacterium]
MININTGNAERYLQKIKEIIVNNTKISFDNFNDAFFYNKITRRIKNLNLTNYQEYYEYLTTNIYLEIKELIPYLTINETYFFRDKAQFEYLEKNIFNNVKKISKKLRILSIGCATGEEPYSIAMCAENAIAPDFSNYIEINALDINKKILDSIDNLSYSVNSRKLFNLSEIYKKKYFEINEEDRLILVPIIKKSVKFFLVNAVTEDIGFNYDIIFCKNMMIYLTPKNQELLLKKIYKALNYGGYFFVGASEIISGSGDLIKYNDNNCIFYRKAAEIQKNIKIVEKNNPQENIIKKEPQKVSAEIFTDQKSIIGIIDNENNEKSEKNYYDFLRLLDWFLEINEKKNILLDCSELKYIDYQSCKRLVKTIKILKTRNIDVYLKITDSAIKNKISRAAGDYKLIFI